MTAAGAVLQSPIVYAWISAKNEVRYVGMSRKGLQRPFSREHQIAAKIEPTDVLLVWACQSADDAAAYEGSLLTAIAPPLNRVVPSTTIYAAEEQSA